MAKDKGEGEQSSEIHIHLEALKAEAAVLKEEAAVVTKYLTHFTQFPKPIGRGQIILMFLAWVMMLASGHTCVGLFYNWTPVNYLVFDRRAAVAEGELQLPNQQKRVMMMYSRDEEATNLNYDFYARWAHQACGVFKLDLPHCTDRRRLIGQWVDEHGVDMTQYEKEDVCDYSSGNDWLIRRVKPLLRPTHNPTNPLSLASPADSRVLVFPNWKSEGTYKAWIKGNRFTLKELLGGDGGLAQRFDGGTLAIFRLFFSDYHWFGAPCAGTVEQVTPLDGTILHSDSGLAHNSGNHILYNERVLVVVNCPCYGKVAYIAVSATCNGSVDMKVSKGSKLAKGQDMGTMQFGGSTIVVVTEKNSQLSWDADLVYSSTIPIEQYVLRGQKIAQLASNSTC